MNEDEIIKILQHYLETEEFDNAGDFLIAIDKILDLYQKEKEKNSKAIAHIKACRTNSENYILFPSEIEYLLELLEENKK